MLLLVIVALVAFGDQTKAASRKVSPTLWLIALELEPRRFGVFLDLAQVYALGPERRQFKFEVVYAREEKHGWRRMITTYVRDCRTGQTYSTENLTYFWDGRPPSRIRVVRQQFQPPGKILWDAGQFVCLPDAQREAQRGDFVKFNVPLEDQESFVQTFKPNSRK